MKKMTTLGGVLGVTEGVRGGKEGGNDHIPLYIFVCVCVICMYIYEITKGQINKINKLLNSYDMVLISFGKGIELEVRH